MRKLVIIYFILLVFIISGCKHPDIICAENFLSELNASKYKNDTLIYLEYFDDGRDKKINLTGRLRFYFDTIFVNYRQCIDSAKKIEILPYNTAIKYFDSMPYKCYYEEQKSRVVVIRFSLSNNKFEWGYILMKDHYIESIYPMYTIDYNRIIIWR